jgi:hypothetical protein
LDLKDAKHLQSYELNFKTFTKLWVEFERCKKFTKLWIEFENSSHVAQWLGVGLKCKTFTKLSVEFEKSCCVTQWLGVGQKMQKIYKAMSWIWEKLPHCSMLGC